MTHKRPRRRRGIGRKWFDGRLYRETQPNETFLHPAGSSFHRFVWASERLNELVGDTSKCTAIEIGPGLKPLLPHLPFRKITLVEQSPALAAELNRDPWIKSARPNVIVGDLRALPVRAHYDLMVMNEVLTHVRPAQRLPTLASVLPLANHFFMIDRPWVSLHDLRNRIILYNRMIDRKTGEKPERTPVTTNFLRLFQSTLISFEPIVVYLKQNGWSVRVEQVDSSSSPIAGYTALSAKRINPPK